MYLWEKENVPYYNEEYLEGLVPSMEPYIADGDSPTPLVPHTNMWPENLKNWLESMKYLD